MLHFKLKVLDLIDIYLRYFSSQPSAADFTLPMLRLALFTPISEQQVHSKVIALIKSRFGKPKEFPKTRSHETGVADLTQADLERQLKEVVGLAKKSNGGREFGICCAS